jgi:hypothetical protein
MRKPNFTDKARAIIGNPPKLENLDDFLNENSKDENQYKKEEKALLENDIETSSVEEDTDNSITNQNKISREEFRFSYQLSERLRLAAFSSRKNKTQIVKEALESYLKNHGF